MSSSYTYEKIKIVKVPAFSPTEPALTNLFEAIRLREERENTEHDVEDGLLSIAEELHLRSCALKHQLFEIGRLLCDAKTMLPHGEFKPWVAKNFEHCYRTAVNCMRVYRTCIGQPEIVEYFKPSCLYFICNPNFSPDLRHALFRDARGPVEVNKKRLVEVALKFRNGEIGINDAPVQELLRLQPELETKERCCIELRSLERFICNRLERIAALANHRQSQPLSTDRQEGSEWLEDIRTKIVLFLHELHRTIRELEK